MLKSIQHVGPLTLDTTIPGEQKHDDVFPSQGNIIQVSRDRWLVVFATRGYKFSDNDLSILYQLRADSPDGRIVKEGVLAKAHDAWDPNGKGETWHKQHGHPVAFGVPKGATLQGRPAPHANVFAIHWRVWGLPVATEADWAAGRVSRERTGQGVEWVQVRLNAAEDDLEVIRGAEALRQRGFESVPEIGRTPRGEPVFAMNQSFTNAVPFNDARTEWVAANHTNHIGGDSPSGGILLKYRFSDENGAYEWVESSSFLGDGERGVGELSILQHGDDWIVAGRKHFSPAEPGVAWLRFSGDPFSTEPQWFLPKHPVSDNPLGAQICADGAIRLITNDATMGGRNTLHSWTICPETFEPIDHYPLFNPFDVGLPIRPESGAVVDMGRIAMHFGGSRQMFLHRFRSKSLNYPGKTRVAVNAEEKAHVGIYYGMLEFEQDYPPTWQF